MMWRLKDIPVFSSAPTTIDAEIFNQIRRHTLRSADPIRIPLESTPDIHVLIDEDSWVCVDSTNHDFPIVAWVGFDTHNRNTLHTPIKCQKDYYHFGAGKIASSALEETVAYLHDLFAPAPVCNLIPQNQSKKTWKTNTAAELTCI